MSTAAEIRDTTERCRGYIDQLRDLFRRYNVTTTATLVSTVRTSKEFRAEWKAVWAAVAATEGGKVSLTTAGIIIGTALGGAGLALLGTAIPISLAAVLGIAGFVAGIELDAIRRLRGTRHTMLGVPRDLYGRVQAAARASGMSTDALIISTLLEAYPELESPVAQMPQT